MLPKLQYISQGVIPNDHFNNIEMALDAGVELVQLRLKNINQELYEEFGCKTKELCKQYNAQLIINDNALVAKVCDADALHLGLDDMTVTEARKIFHKQIGGTANTFEHVRQRCTEKVDYIGLGPFRFTQTKDKLSPILGLKGYVEIINKMKQLMGAEALEVPVEIPIYAIGGIELQDIEAIMQTGVYGIAVSGLITNATNKKDIVKQIYTDFGSAQSSKTNI